eukprot:gene3951-15282_t
MAGSCSSPNKISGAKENYIRGGREWKYRKDISGEIYTGHEERLRLLAKMMSNDRYHIVALAKSPDPLESIVTYTVEDIRYGQELECFPDDNMERLEQQSEDFKYLIASKKGVKSAETILNIGRRPEQLELEITKCLSRKHKAQLKCGQEFLEIGKNKFKEREKSQLEMIRERPMQEATEDAMLEEFRDTWI